MDQAPNRGLYECHQTLRWIGNHSPGVSHDDSVPCRDRWRLAVKSRVDAIGDGIFKAADNSLQFMDEKLDRIENAFKNGNRRIGLISNAVNHLPEKGAEIKTETISLLKSLDEEVFEPLKTAETWIDSTHAVAVGVGKISEAMVTSEYAASHKDSMGVEMAERLQSCSESLVEILTTLQEVRQGLIDIRDDAASARRIAARVVARLAQIEHQNG